MKLDYVPKGMLVRLYDFTPEEVEQLWAAVRRLAAGAVERVEVHKLLAVEAVDNCRLDFRVDASDRGMVQSGESTSFECSFTVAAWQDIAGLIEPFTRDPHGFQWLAGGPGAPSLLLSVDGRQ